MASGVAIIITIMVIIHMLRTLSLEAIDWDGKRIHELWNIIYKFHHIWSQTEVCVPISIELIESFCMKFIFFVLVVSVMPVMVMKI